MFKFENPLDPSKDGINPLIDGIRYNIRNSESIKEEILSNLNYFINQYLYLNYEPSDSPSDVLDFILMEIEHDADELIIADEHELLDEIKSHMSWIG